MNMFTWLGDALGELVANGQEDLADRIMDIDVFVHEASDGVLDAELAPLLRQVDELENSWLSIWAHHWAHVHWISTGAGERLMPKVLDAFELASQPKNHGCPQSVCTIQDLCGTWANLDAEGSIEDRLAVIHETVDRIDPTWNCYECLADELAEALIDGGRPGEARVELRSRLDHHIDAGRETTVVSAHNLAQTFLAEENWQGALDQLEESFGAGIKPTDSDRFSYAASSSDLRHGAHEVEALTGLGRVEDAIAAQPDTSELRSSQRSADHWLRALLALELARSAGDAAVASTGPHKNTWDEARVAHQVATEAEAGGGWYVAATLRTHLAHLAALRGARWVQQAELAAARAAREHLSVAPRLDQRLSAAAAAPLAPVRDRTSPEYRLDALLDHDGRPLDPETALECAALCRSLDRPAHAVEFLWQRVADDETAADVVATSIFASADRTLGERFARDFATSRPQLVARVLGHRAAADGLIDDCVEHFTRLAEQADESPSLDVVCVRYGYGAGEDRDDPQTVAAERVGPCQWRVVEITGPSDTERVGDIVIVDPSSFDDDDLPTASVLHVASAGQRTAWTFHGVHPGAEAWAQFHRWLTDLGHDANQWSDDDFTVVGSTSPDVEEPASIRRMGVTGAIATASGVDLTAFLADLEIQMKDWPEPLTLVDLAQASDDRKALAAHRRRRRAITTAD